MGIDSLKRPATRGRGATVGEHIGARYRSLGATLAAAGLLSASSVLLALGGDIKGVLVCSALTALALAGAGVAAILGYRDLMRSVATPVERLNADLSRSAEAMDRVLGGAADLQQLALAVGALGQRLEQVQRRRADDENAGNQRAGVLREVLRLTKKVGSSNRLQDVLAATAGGACAISGHSEVMIWFVDEVEHRLVPAFDSTATPPTASLVPPQPIAASAAGRAATAGQTVTVRADRADPDRATGLAVPLSVGTGLSVRGVIELSRPGRPMGPDAVDALETLAGHAALAIEASKLYAEVERRSETDALTKVLNRRRLDQDIRSEIARSLRAGHALSLVMVDVDHFKGINDTFGHQMGDEVLKLVALTLNRECRTTDGAYRFGGEEFALLFRDTDASTAGEVADRIRMRIRDAVATLGLSREVTASLGVSALSSSIRTAEKLVEAADGALYAAKHDGRNRVVVSEQS